VTVNNPAGGQYRVVVDGYAVPRQHDVRLRRRVHQPGLRCRQHDRHQRRPTGRRVLDRAPATVTAKLAPATGRVLLGNVQVRTDGNVLVGSGDVVVGSVTP
jgi:hypothetical protein